MNIPIIIIVGQKRDGVQKWLSQNPIPFPFLIDEDRNVIKLFDVYHPIGIDAYKIAYPSLFFISEYGKIVYAYVGENQKDRPNQNDVYKKVHDLLGTTISND